MSIRHGSGARLWTLFITLLLVAADVGASDATLGKTGWRPIASLSVAAHSPRTIIVEQAGVHGVLGVFRDGELLHEQAGPWGRLAYEVVVLEQPGLYEIRIRTRYQEAHGKVTHHELLDLEAEQLEIARGLQRASRTHYEFEFDVERRLKPTAIERLQNKHPHLEPIAYLMLLSGLTQLERYQSVIHHAAELPTTLNDCDRRYAQWLKAQAYQNLQNIDRALSEYGSIGHLCSSNDDLYVQAEFVGAWGMAHVVNGLRSGDPEKMSVGREKIDEALLLVADRNVGVLRAELLNYQAAHQSMIGDRTGAIQTLELAASYLRQAGNQLFESMIQNNLAFNYQALGDLGAAQRALLSASTALEQLGVPDSAGMVSSGLAANFSLTGDDLRAALYFQKAIDRFESIDLRLGVLRSKLELANIARKNGNPQQALVEHQALLAEYKGELDQWVDERSHLYAALTRDAVTVNDLELAAQYVGVVRELRDKPTRFHFNIELYLTEAEYLLAVSDPMAAQSLLEVALDQFRADSQDLVKKFEVLSSLTRAALQQGDESIALGFAEQGNDVAVQIRAQLGDWRSGPTWSRIAERHHTEYVGLMLSASLLNEKAAFASLQRERALSLRKRHHRARRRGEMEDHSALADAMVLANSRLIEAENRGWETQMLREQAVLAEDAFRAQQAQGAMDQSALPELSVTEMQTALAPDQLLLSYLLGENHNYLFVITRDEFQTHALEVEDSLSGLVSGVLNELTGLEPGRARGAKLGALLFGQIQERTRYREVIIEVPGVLNRVPIGSFLDSGGDRYLGQAAVIYTPSATEYFTNVSEPTDSAPTSVAVFADPAYNFSNQLAGVDVDLDVQGLLPGLPHTRREAGSIGRIFGVNNVQTFVGEAANRLTLVADEVRSAEIVHIATHGFHSDRYPDLAGLLIAPTENHSGFLTTSDISQYPYLNELVVISGCNTARGELLGSEGMVGLARTFLSSGARSAIGTLWPVSDRASAEFMAHFYQALKQHGRSAQALFSAQQQMQRSRRFRHPQYWASFVLYSLSDQTTF